MPDSIQEVLAPLKAVLEEISADMVKLIELLEKGSPSVG